MIPRLGFFTFVALAALLAPLSAAQPVTPPFTFAALGCMPYARVTNADAAFARVIAEINRHVPAFTVHLGDTMASDEKATDALLMKRRADFDTFATALVYTPGDNEWTDTYTEKSGGYRPTERLATIRRMYFSEERSLGKKPIALITQRRDPTFSGFRGDARWSHGGVIFATVHVVGSSNNHLPNVPGALDEWRARDAANAAWIRAAFAAAHESNAPRGRALLPSPALPAQPRSGRLSGGLRAILEDRRGRGRRVRQAGAARPRRRTPLPPRSRHALRKPLGPARKRHPPRDLGAADMHAVLVTVDPASAQVFLAAPLIVPDNALPVLPKPPATKAK